VAGFYVISKVQQLWKIKYITGLLATVCAHNIGCFLGAPNFLGNLEAVSKAEHESGLPAAHYRYTRGKTCGYGNSRVRVTRWLKPARIQV
jgi:hypothetical protein